MTQILELITKAEAEDRTVIITDDEGYIGLERVKGNENQWYVVGENGWIFTTEQIAQFNVIDTDDTDKGLFVIRTDAVI